MTPDRVVLGDVAAQAIPSLCNYFSRLPLIVEADGTESYF